MSKQKAKGTRFETQVVNYLREMLPFLDIERKALTGSKDEGDIRGLSIRGKKCVIECKSCKKVELAKWADEAEVERTNADAEFAFVVFHRRGCGDKSMGRTYVLTDLDNLTAIVAGARDLRGDD